MSASRCARNLTMAPPFPSRRVDRPPVGPTQEIERGPPVSRTPVGYGASIRVDDGSIMTVQRVSLITLGVADLTRARRFYAALGWHEHAQSQDALAFFQLHGSVLALFDLAALAEDQGRPAADLGTGAATLAQNFATREEVDAAYLSALSSGATPLKPPEEVFWGGYSGYWADPAGHVWEVAMNPYWPLAEDGRLTLPDPPDD